MSKRDTQLSKISNQTARPKPDGKGSGRADRAQGGFREGKSGINLALQGVRRAGEAQHLKPH